MSDRLADTLTFSLMVLPMLLLAWGLADRYLL